MTEWLVQIDAGLFLFCNRTLGHPIADRFWIFITNGEHWVIAVAIASLVFLALQKWRGLGILIGVAVVFAACDQASAHLLKPVFERVRPCHVIEGARALIGCSAAYSFPSAHATNTFGCALWLSYFYPRQGWVFFGLSALVSLSRVFVGVHYPFDVLGGWLLGAIIALAAIGGLEVARRTRSSGDEGANRDH